MTDFAPAKPLKRNSWVRHSFDGSTARFDYGFDAANRIKYEQRDSGAADGFSFDPRNELTGFNQNGTLNANGTVSATCNLSITYDANGNRKRTISVTVSLQEQDSICGAMMDERSKKGSELNIENHCDRREQGQGVSP